MIQGVACGGGARGDIEFAVNRAQVRVDSDGTEHKLLCNLGIGQTLSQETQGINLARRQAESARL